VATLFSAAPEPPRAIIQQDDSLCVRVMIRRNDSMCLSHNQPAEWFDMPLEESPYKMLHCAFEAWRN